jgi:hypothetical protein
MEAADVRTWNRMIGVIFRKPQESMVEEFFELFKTPWEPVREGGVYDVVLTTNPGVSVPPARLLLAFCSGPMSLDDQNGIRIHSLVNGGDVEWKNSRIPVYGRLATFVENREPVVCRKGIEATESEPDFAGRSIFRIGYDLFDEIEHLLLRGQPVENARIPTIEMHISMLRQWILGTGIPLVEIPPSPLGYDFITCLTHDIDFMGIRDHVFDHSMFGFVYRSLIPKYLKGLDKKTAAARYRKNLRALLSLPLVQTGILPDFWYPLEKYPEVEKERKSTFFFIPFKNRSGGTPAGNHEKYRAARYDVGKHTNPIRGLKRQGREIGLHGIDAWKDAQKGKEEIGVIRRITGEDRIGVRMHWLFFSDDTPRHLEEAGARYDSTLGYNEAVGYRSGTTQVFRLPGTKNLYELPLHAQDTAMLYPGRMGMSESVAIDLCGKLIGDFRAHGGAFTINWHDRSLAPERNWDAAYLELLRMLTRERTWFATGGEAVHWFEKRRACRFDASAPVAAVPNVTLGGPGTEDGPPVTLRVHRPISSDGETARFEDYCIDHNRNFVPSIPADL